MKILLSCPTSEHKDYCYKEWCKHVKSLTVPENVVLEVLIIDNSKNSEYHKKIEKDFKCHYIALNEHETIHEVMQRCYEYMRAYFLENNYDYLFSLESDQFPPVNIIEYLLFLNKPVVGIPYFVYNHYLSKVMEFDMEDFGAVRQSMTKEIDKTFIETKGRLKEAYMVGLGCLLINKRIIELVPFRLENDGTESHTDTFFHDDLRKNGIPVYIDDSYMCFHQNKSWFDVKRKH